MNSIKSKTALASQVTALPSIQNEALAEIITGIYQGKPLLGPGGLLNGLIKDLSQVALKGEMDVHMADSALEDGANRKNGSSYKTVKTGAGSFELETPRDRNGTFEPQFIKKRETVLNDELDNKILALYSLGTGYDAIANHLQEI